MGGLRLLTFFQISHPGINYLVKHIGGIFRRLFSTALEDVKAGEQFFTQFQMLPPVVERFLLQEYEIMVWDLMVGASDKSHDGLEPYFSTIDPSLPTFHPVDLDSEDRLHDKYELVGNDFVPAKSKGKQIEEGLLQKATQFLGALQSIGSGSGGKLAKSLLKEENKKRASKKSGFLSEERTMMITDSEADKILVRAFQYIVGLMEFLLVAIKFQINHHLILGFKNKIKNKFISTVLNKAEWSNMVRPDPEITDQLAELNISIEGLKDSLQEVNRMQRRL